MAPSFPAYLTELIRAKGLNPHRFALKARLPPDSIYMILGGHRPPPAKHIEAMSAALDLAGVERHTFLVRAALAHTPVALQALIEESQRRLKLPSLSDLLVFEDQLVAANPPVRRQRRKQGKKTIS